MNKDQVKGRFEEVKGKVMKSPVRRWHHDLEQEGKIQNAEGKVQAKYV